MTSSDRPANPTQVPSNLPGVTRHITGHSPTGRAIVVSSTPGQWTSLMNDTAAFNVVYTTSTFPPDLNNDADLAAHERTISDPARPLGLVHPGGTVCRIVDFGPGTEPLVHRTQSLDYGVVLEGEVDMILDDGVVVQRMGRGDVAVQRATNHGWKNVTPDGGWLRMLFVLQSSEKLVVGGKEMAEDLENAESKEGLQSQTTQGS